MAPNHNEASDRIDEPTDERRRDLLKTVGLGAAGIGLLGSEFGGAGTAAAQVNGEYTPRARTGGFTDGGLEGEYYDNPDLSGSPAFTRTDVRAG
jgi:hypothetical protein